MTIGAIAPTDSRSRLFSTSTAHLALSVYFACPVGIPYSSIRRIFMPFSYGIWICTVVAICFTILLLFLNKRTRSSGKSEKSAESHGDYATLIFDVIGSFLGNPLTAHALRASALLGFILWLLASFFLRNVYLGSLFNLLTAQVNQKSVDTLERVIEHNYTIYCTVSTYELLSKTVPKLQNQ